MGVDLYSRCFILALTKNHQVETGLWQISNIIFNSDCNYSYLRDRSIGEHKGLFVKSLKATLFPFKERNR